ncbi:FAD-dependent oxidoreductase [Streptomyces rubradiris]|uniref:FAD-linked oxidase n=1 Tax=Streptomyces rubradiris TaxID=285531 RepID=A0ABQ3R8X2_STRRR|nr:FAD-binding protein [Streptomyces rubradiris]GHG99012.1 FAD-linked oxidase [Streptomyces rubradiris]GHI52304.1 FAD-linked oxidase [Streptomyces rubradiris]
MAKVTRRGVLAGAAAVGGATAGLGLSSATAAADAARTGAPGAVTVGPGDTRYASLTRRGSNARFVGAPDYVRVASSTRDVVDAVQRAVDEGRRIAVRSGGHCFENFVDDPAVKALIDLSPMSSVSYDARRRAFAVEPGALLGEVYRRLFLGWGVTVPAGATAEVGVGGHVLGGGYGALSRRYGLSVDHLYAVEVVVVDERGRARSVVATREPGDPHRDLWWAHTGGGGGNFGIVTRYWFRSPGAKGSDPSRLLPRAPESVLSFSTSWSWKDLDRQSFTRLVTNHGGWYEHNSAPGSPYAGLFGVLMLNNRRFGTVDLVGQVDATGAGARRLVGDYVTAVGAGVRARPTRTMEARPWLQAAAAVQESEPTYYKAKAAYLRRRFTDRQTDELYAHLSSEAAGAADGSVWLVSYGGQVNAVAPGETAVAQRDSVLKAIYLTSWRSPDAEGAALGWVRDLYRAVYADTGGVPVPGAVSDGSFINYPDADLTDPALNTSGTPWHTLYYKDHYARLQRVKARWDPRDEFRHALSVRLPE